MPDRPADHAHEEDDRVQDIVAEYVERLNLGDEIRPDEVLSEHPDLAAEILDHLECFLDLASRPSADDNHPLGTLGDYTLRRQIGRGGMGVVYEAWENSIDRAVALKVLPAGVAADSTATTRFMREAQAAGKLNHQNVVAVYSMGITQQTPYYAMEFVEGETLAQILARTKDAEPDSETRFGPKDQVGYFAALANAFADVADGLQHAHSRGVTHRDIKPSNLILDQDGRLRILDFGLARLEGHESLTLSGDFVGTPLYMSPEQARRKKVPVDHRTDVYSLGATMYEATCGRPPFRGKDHVDTLSQIIERDPSEPRKVNPRVPKDLETIVLKCLRKDSGDRYGTAEALGQDLRRFVRGDAVEAKPEARHERVLRYVRRRAWPVGISFTFLILIVALAGQWQRIFLANQAERQQRYREEVEAAVLDLYAGITYEGSWQSATDSQAESASISAVLVPRTAEVDAALKRLENIHEEYPQHPDALYHLARGRLLLRNSAAARSAIEELRREHPSFTPLAWLDPGADTSRRSQGSLVGAWIQADTKLRAYEWREAASALDRIVRGTRNQAQFVAGAGIESRLARGYARWKSGALQEALVDFGVVQSWMPDAEQPVLLMGMVYQRLGETDVAARLFEDLYTRSDAQDATAMRIANSYSRLGAHDLAHQWIERLRNEDSRDRLKIRNNRFLSTEESLTLAERLVQRNPEDRRLRCDLAIIYARLGRHAEADEQLHAVQNDAVPFEGLELTRGCVLLHAGHVAEATQIFVREAARRPGDTKLRLAIGEALHFGGHHEEAIDWFRAAIEITPSIVGARIRLGHALMRLRRFDEAKATLIEATRLAPNSAETHYASGKLYFIWDKFGAAETAFDRALSIHPENLHALVEAGANHIWQNRLDDAEELLQRALRLDPDWYGAHFVYSKIPYRRGDVEKTVEHLERAVRLAPRRYSWVSRPARGLARVHKRLSRWSAAAAAHATGIGAMPEDRWHVNGLIELLHHRGKEIDCTRLDDLVRFLDARTRKRPGSTSVRLALATALTWAPNSGNPRRALEILSGLEDSQGPLRRVELLLYADAAQRVDPTAVGVRRLALYPRVVPLEAFDHLVTTAPREETGTASRRVDDDPLSELQSHAASPARRAHLEGWIARRRGDYVESAARFLKACELSDHHSASARQYVTSLRLAGNSELAAAYIEDVLTKSRRSAGLADLWLDVVLHDIELDAAEVHTRVERLGSKKTAAAGGQFDWFARYAAVLVRGETLRISCGSMRRVETADRSWLPDRFYLGGHPAWSNEVQAAGAFVHYEYDPVWHSERYFPFAERVDPAYRIPLPRGEYRVVVHMIRHVHEVYHRPPSSGRFEVEIGKQRRRPVFAANEHRAPHRASLIFDGIEVAGTSLTISLHAAGDGPTISAIEIQRLESARK